MDIPKVISVQYETGSESLGWLRNQVKAYFTTRSPWAVHEVEFLLDGQLLQDDDNDQPLNYFTISSSAWLVRLLSTPLAINICIIKSGKNFTCNIYPNDTIEELRERIQDLVNIPSDRQLLTFGRRSISDRRCLLSEYGIRPNATINLEIVPPPPSDTRRFVCGGGHGVEFVDLTNNNGLQIQHWSKTMVPVWRFACRGLNLEGKNKT